MDNIEHQDLAQLGSDEHVGMCVNLDQVRLEGILTMRSKTKLDSF